MSRLRISDQQSIRNLMQDGGPSSRWVRQLDIVVRGGGGKTDRVQVDLRDPASGDAPPGGAPDRLTEPDPGSAASLASRPEAGHPPTSP